jgi:hypothetical protein
VWHIQCSRRSSSTSSFLSACLPIHPPSPSPFASSARVSLLRSSRTPSRVSPARVSLLYSSNCNTIAAPDWAAERALMIVRTFLSNMHRTAIAKYAPRPSLLSSPCVFRAPVLSQRAEQQR